MYKTNSRLLLLFFLNYSRFRFNEITYYILIGYNIMVLLLVLRRREIVGKKRKREGVIENKAYLISLSFNILKSQAEM